MKNLTRRAWNGQASLEYESTWVTDNGTRLRVQIDRDCYDFQCHLRCQVWSPATSTWNEIGTLPIAHSRIKEHGYVTKADVSMFRPDEQTLLQEAVNILAEKVTP